MPRAPARSRPRISCLASRRTPTQPAIGRATAYAELAEYLSPNLFSEVQKGLHDSDELVRLGALHGLAGVPADQRWGLASHLLTDPVRAVRLETVSFLLPVRSDSLTAEQRVQLDRASDEYVAAQRVNADRPESHLNLGLLYSQRGQPVQAEAEYRKALQLDPEFARAYVNLADLYRDLARDADGEKLLREALQVVPRDAAVHHSLGCCWPGRSAMRKRSMRLRRRHASRRTMRAMPMCTRWPWTRPASGARR